MTEQHNEQMSDLPAPTVPDRTNIRLKDFTDEGQAQELGHILSRLLKEIGRYINIGRLDGVTVAHDYANAISEIDRGFEPSVDSTPTADQDMVGTAMTVPVLREGTVKAHLVFRASDLLGLLEDQEEALSEALYLVAHECAHVEDLKCRDENFPGVLLQQGYTSRMEGLLQPIASGLWEEYIACYISARFAPEHAGAYEECFVPSLARAHEDTIAAITSYRLHGDPERLLRETSDSLCKPLQTGAYLIGHLDGIGESWSAAKNASVSLENSQYSPFIEDLASALRSLRDRRGEWDSMEDFADLHDLICDVLEHGGVVLEEREGGAMAVDMSSIQETVPDLD